MCCGRVAVLQGFRLHPLFWWVGVCGVFLVFVSTITAMSLWVPFSIELRLVVLPVIPFAFA